MVRLSSIIRASAVAGGLLLPPLTQDLSNPTQPRPLTDDQLKDLERQARFSLASRPHTKGVLTLNGVYCTRNFSVVAPTPELAESLGDLAEMYRKTIALELLGKELPTWSAPATLRVKIDLSKSGGATTFTFGPDGVKSIDLQIQGVNPDLTKNTLPHEVTHAVLTTYFGRRVPRWADEGIAQQYESAGQKLRYDNECRISLNQGRGIRLRVLFQLTEYPKDILVLYRQGHSVANFLKEYRSNLGDRASQDLLLQFVSVGMQDDQRNWDAAAKLYGFDSVDRLEEAWLESLKVLPNLKK